MKSERLFDELEEIVSKHGYKVRKEKGSFRSDTCKIEGSLLIVINKLHPIEYQVSILAKLIFDNKLDQSFIKPAVRKELDKIWKTSNYTQIDLLNFEVQ